MTDSTLTLTITEKGGDAVVRHFQQSEISIGRIQDNDIVLNKNNISKRHARIVHNGTTLVVVDAKSTNGTYINGRRISAPYDIQSGDRIFVGDYAIDIATPSAPGQSEFFDDSLTPLPVAPPPPPESSTQTTEEMPPTEDMLAMSVDASEGEPHFMAEYQDVEFSQALPPPPPPEEIAEPSTGPLAESFSEPPTPSREMLMPYDRLGTLARLHDYLSDTFGLSHANRLNLEATQLVALVQDSLSAAIDNMRRSGEIPADTNIAELMHHALGEAADLGPLAALLGDENISRIYINGTAPVLCDYRRPGQQRQASDARFSCIRAVQLAVERLVARSGITLNAQQSCVDARLNDGSKITATLAPLAITGPAVMIHKANVVPLQIDDLVIQETLSYEQAEQLSNAVAARQNILVVGPHGAGKTSLLGILCGLVDASERIIAIENTCELQLEAPNAMTFELRNHTSELTRADVLRQALRLQPDRLIVDELQSSEAFDFIRAASPGGVAVMSTLNAYSIDDALNCLASMLVNANPALSNDAARTLIRSNIHLVVHVARTQQGNFRIQQIF